MGAGDPRVARRPTIVVVAAVVLAAAAAPGAAQNGPRQWNGVPAPELPDGPFVIHTAEEPDVRVVVVTRGLSHPWSLVFLPDGAMLVTEREGRLRVIRDGVLDPTPVAGVPEVFTGGRFTGLMEVALHPKFAENGYVYLTYSTAGEPGAVALARARFDGRALRDLSEIFRVEPPGLRTASARLAFAPDGTLYLTMGGAFNAGTSGLRAQDPNDYAGKVLRLRDDGSVPDDNPFVGQEGHRPEVFALGFRNPMGLTIHPVTGAVWAHEHSVQGGDEANVIVPGRNYGWPVVSYGREYSGPRVAPRPWQEGMELPEVVWIPSIAPSGMVFYTGDRFPTWQGNLFVGSLMTGRIQRTGHVERIVFNEDGEEIRRESILGELRQRIRDVRQGPDGLLYLLTEEDEAAVLRLEPVR
jgi:glucose/arabinose dehydrogenase